MNAVDDTFEPTAVRVTPAKAAKDKAAQEERARNEADERNQLEEQQFLKGFSQIKDIKTNIALEMGDAKEVYAKLKTFGFTKADVKWAFELEEKDSGEILATMQRRLRIAKMLGHGIARQFELFEQDRTPLEDRAYEEGLAAGKLRKEMANPYDLSSEAGQAWQRGFNDGTAFINKELADHFAKDGDELISGHDADDPFAEAAE